MAEADAGDVEDASWSGPVGSDPILMPRSRARGMAPILPYRRAAMLADRDPVCACPSSGPQDVRLHEPRAEIWVGVSDHGTEVPGPGRR